MTTPRPASPLLRSAAAALAAFAGATTPAQDAPKDKPDPEVQALLARMRQFRGKAATQPLTLTVEGTYAVTFGGAEQPVAKGAFQEWFQGTDLARHRSDMGPMGVLERGLHRDQPWEVDPVMGAKLRTGAAAGAVRRYCALLRGDDPAGLYARIERAGTGKVGEHDVVLLRGTPTEGPADTWHVGADGTIHRVDMKLPAPETSDASFGGDDTPLAQIALADWKELGGLRVPHRRTLTMGPATVTFLLAKVVVGRPIEAERFTPPEAVQKLKPEVEPPPFDADGRPVYRVVERKAQPVASIRLKCKPDDVGATLSIVLPEVMAHLQAVGARMAGAPFSRYHAFGPDEIDLEAGIPVQAAFAEKGRVKNGELPAGRAATAWHVGPYEKLGPAHEALAAWVAAQKLEAAGGPWEIYWTDPGMVPDPQKWRTQLFLPVQ